MVELKKQTNILTIREFEILELLIKGYSTREISSFLNISPETVTTYRKKLLKKFKVKNCVELIYVLMKLNLL